MCTTNECKIESGEHLYLDRDNSTEFFIKRSTQIIKSISENVTIYWACFTFGNSRHWLNQMFSMCELSVNVLGLVSTANVQNNDCSKCTKVWRKLYAIVVNILCTRDQLASQSRISSANICIFVFRQGFFAFLWIRIELTMIMMCKITRYLQHHYIIPGVFFG